MELKPTGRAHDFQADIKQEPLYHSYKYNSEMTNTLENILESTENVNSLKNGVHQPVITLTSSERNRLCELQSAGEIFPDENGLCVSKVLTELSQLEPIDAYYRRKVRAFASHLEPFRGIPAKDQVLLLNGSTSELGLIRAAFRYKKEENGFTLVENFKEDSAVFLNLSLYNGSRIPGATSIYGHFLQSLSSEMEGDVIIRDLLLGKQLFYPRKGLESPEFARYQHHMYVSLLKRYLEEKYQSQQSASKKFTSLWRLLDNLDLIKSITQSHLEEVTGHQLTHLEEYMIEVRHQTIWQFPKYLFGPF